MNTTASLHTYIHTPVNVNEKFVQIDQAKIYFVKSRKITPFSLSYRTK